MRVIAGKYRSRPIKGPGAQRLRPTSDRLRETLFNVLGPSLEDSLFIDLFAGTGAVGIEAISRGARETIFVESNAKAARLIRENLKSLDIGSAAELIEAPAVRGLEKIEPAVCSLISSSSTLPTKKPPTTRKSSNSSTPRTSSPRAASLSSNTIGKPNCPNF